MWINLRRVQNVHLWHVYMLWVVHATSQ